MEKKKIRNKENKITPKESHENIKNKDGGKISKKYSDCIKELEEIKNELTEEKDKYLRLYAEFDNYKKRMAKERLEILAISNMDTMISILPVLDDMEIAKTKSIENDENKGFLLIMDKLLNIMKSKGLEEIQVKKGDDFNVDIHEAVTSIPIDNQELEGKVFDVILNGYKLNGKIIRHSKVVIAKKK